MRAVGLLMQEHKLITRMVNVIKKTQDHNDDFLKDVIDFFENYADKRHHKKEEDVLFERLKTKDMSDEHKKIMERLLKEHQEGREIMHDLEDLPPHDEREDFLNEITKMYPEHIIVEDKHFFIPVMIYFTEEEQNKMFEDMQEFDSKLDDEKYKQIVAKYEE